MESGILSICKRELKSIISESSKADWEIFPGMLVVPVLGFMQGVEIRYLDTCKGYDLLF